MQYAIPSVTTTKEKQKHSYLSTAIQPTNNHHCNPGRLLYRKLRDIASNLVDGQELNHALIQLYRNGDDYISEHADKTLDIERGSSIVNLSIGATRTMILRPKKETGSSGNIMVLPKGTPRPSTRVKMDHASLFVLGWETNQRMTHEIKRDKRDDKFKTDHERAFDGVRISITLRKVATFLCTDDGSLVGQGAPNKAKSLVSHSPALLANAMEEEDMLLKAFSTENRRSDYDWEELYGDGFSVVNFRITNNQEESTTAGDANANENGTGSGSDVLNIDSAAVDPAQDDLVNVHMLSRC